MEVDNKSIVMFFKKGLRDPSQIRKLTMKKPRTSEAIFAITNRFALTEETTLNTREQKEKESSHTDQPSSSKATKRRGKWVILSTRWNDHDAARSTGPGRVNLKDSGIACAFSTPGESTRHGTATDSKVLQMWCSGRPKGPIRRKSPRIPRETSLKLIRRSITYMVARVK
jgi:hypothetical protein